MKVLLASGAEINATDKVSEHDCTSITPVQADLTRLFSIQDGWTPLHAACRQENIDVVKILVSADADLLCRSRVSVQDSPVALCNRLHINEVSCCEGWQTPSRLRIGPRIYDSECRKRLLRTLAACFE